MTKKLLISAVFMCLIILCGCKAGANDEEIKNAAAALIEKSYAINEIYFGEGLPYIDESVVGVSTLYSPVDPSCGYKTIDEIKNATAAVYSSVYREYLYTIAFEGVSLDEDNTVYARYIEDHNGEITVKRDLKETGKKLERTFDFSTITVEKVKGSRAKIKVMSLVSGNEDIEITLSLVCENGVWLLDEPTY